MFFDQSTKITLLDDDVLNVRRSNGGYLYADRAELTTCDMVSTKVHSLKIKNGGMVSSASEIGILSEVKDSLK